MFWVRFWSYLMGYLTLLVEGEAVEKLVNMAVSRGIYLWDIRWLGPQKILLKARVSSFRALRHIIKRTGGKMKIKNKKGLPFATAKVLRRKMMVVGALTCVAVLYILSSFVWFIDVAGNKKVSTDIILKTAEKAGLYTGTAKWKLDSSEVEKRIKTELPGISWVGINITGTKAIIRVAEKVTPPVEDDRPAHIVANKTGLIEEVLVLSGVAAAKEGEMVKKGDLLISGIIESEIEAPIEKENPEQLLEGEKQKVIRRRFVRARGIIKARVWYDGYGEAQLKTVKTVETGRYVRKIVVKLGQKSISIQGSARVPFKSYIKKEEVERLPAWRNLKIPVEVLITYYYETKPVTEKIAFDEAKKLAIQKAKSQFKLPAQVKLLKEKTYIIKTKEPDLVRVKVMVETLENIGSVRPLTQNEMKYETLEKKQEVRHN
ncbi:sporulation protein YqfD [Thermincola ferriacetica]